MLINVVAITGTAFDTIIESNNASTKPSTFVGSIVTTNLNNGSTPYMQLWAQTVLKGMTIPQLVQGSMIVELYKELKDSNSLTQEDLIKMQNAINLDTNEIAFIALIFNGDQENQSVLNIGDITGGVVNFDEIEGKDTLNKYVKLDLLQGVGSVLLFNLNFLNN